MRSRSSRAVQLSLVPERPGRASARVPVPREEQLTILRCPVCRVFLGYKGVGRHRIVCAAPACQSARRRERIRRREAASRSVRIRLVILLAHLLSGSCP